MSKRVTVSFVGPFSWPGTSDAPSVFDGEEGRASGVYLWTVPLQEGYLVYYVGETGRNFRTRLLEHYLEHAAAMYHVYSPTEFARGEKIALWPGRYDTVHRRSAKECISNYLLLCEQIKEMTFLLRFFLAPLSCEDRVRRRVEAAIANTLYAKPGIVGAFQDRGIRYHLRRDDEEPIECLIASLVPLLGLSERILV
ncbi:MAG: hypothetical protein NTV33_12840 [Coprothermobacterota bacterium]|nr:hypothetical protein [Coprothermobacterota bacterium]